MLIRSDSSRVKASRGSAKPAYGSLDAGGTAPAAATPISAGSERTILLFRECCRVYTEKIVAAVPSRRFLLHHVGGRELTDQPCCFCQGDFGQDRGVLFGKLSTWYKSDQPEQPSGVGGECLIGEVEGHAQCGMVVVLNPQRGHWIALSKMNEVGGNCLLRVANQVHGRDAQRQRQVELPRVWWRP